MALLFDGIDDRAVTGVTAGVPTGYPFTLAAIVSGSFAGAPRGVLALGTAGADLSWRLIVQASGVLRVALGAAGFNFNSLTVTADEQTFIAVTCLSDSQRRGYLYRYPARTDAVENSTTTVATGAPAAPALKVGCAETSPGVFANFFNGTITWAAAWDRYLGSVGDGYDQLRALAHLGPRAMGKPAFLAEFLEGQGSTIYDRSGNGNHAAMSNFPASPWQPVGLPGPWWTRRSRRVVRFVPWIFGSEVTARNVALRGPAADDLALRSPSAQGLAIRSPRASDVQLIS